jgi:hypothetical protein
MLNTPFESGEAVERWVQSQFTKFEPAQFPDKAAIDNCFALSSPFAGGLNPHKSGGNKWWRNLAAT